METYFTFILAATFLLSNKTATWGILCKKQKASMNFILRRSIEDSISKYLQNEHVHGDGPHI